MVRSILQMGRAAGCLLVALTHLALPARVYSQARPPCGACIAIALVPTQIELLPERLNGLDVLVRIEREPKAAALEAIRRRGGRPGLLIAGLPDVPLPPDIVGTTATLIADVRAVTMPADKLAFELKTRMTAIRAAAPANVQLGVAATPEMATSLLSRDLSSYVDFFVRTDQPPPRAAGMTWQEQQVLTSVPAALGVTREGNADRWLWRAPENAATARQMIEDLAKAAQLLPQGLVPASGTRVTCGGRDAEVFLDPRSLEQVALAEDCGPDAVLNTTPPQLVAERISLSSGASLVHLPSTPPDRFAEGVAVTAERQLTVEEIIARHQAAAARQTALVRTLISSGTQALTFEAPGFAAPVTITSDTVIYTSRDRTEIEQRAIRINGIEFKNGGATPRLPILEPERVASPPLAITLTDVYHYRLERLTTIDGIHCYIVAFEPVRSGRTLFRGRAWIAMEDFGLVKVAAAQTALRGPIVSSEQTDEFQRAAGGIWLLARSDVRQIYEGAAHRTPIHRVLTLTAHEINPDGFTARRAAAYASDSLMLRDTPEGYRYLRRQRTAEVTEGAPAVAGRAGRVRTLAFGVIVDPNITRPLPFAGMSYVDFDLFGTGTQLSVFFGGTYAQLAFAAPSLAGSRWQLAGRASGIASSYNDRAFAAGREQYEENVRQRPAQASVWVLRPLSSRISVRVGYDLDYTHFARSDVTAEAFIAPVSQVVHGLRFALDGQRAGWNGSIWWSPARRQHWRPWGRPGSSEYDPAQRDFQRYGASLTRSAVMTPRLVLRSEAAWMAGSDLDRFSRFWFGAFDNRLRGYPSALIRYDRGGVLRGALAWSAGRFVRVDGFADTAWVHDPGFGRGLKNFTGLGGAIEAPAPFGTLVAVEWGFGVQGVNTNGTRGTQVIRVSGYKVF